MKLIRRQDVPLRPLPGRAIQLVVGQQGAASPSNLITMGFARYAAEYGPMSPHRHAEEVVVVLESERGYVRFGGFGDQPDELGERIPLEPDMILHFPENEWHVFEYDEGGSITIAFFYPSASVYAGQISK
ncbi:MAG: hypothetical protein H5T60_09755 [Anaerolineae bacterium]|nr:hypothetical protein [Anaerolineae bacterium]